MTESNKILEWVKGDCGAAAMIEKLFQASQIADDFVDDDKPIDKSLAMSELLMISMVEIPANPFYRTNQGFIAPLLVAVIAAFNTSNKLQKSQIEDCAAMAWALRDALEHLIVSCAYIKGGAQWAFDVSLEVTQFFRTNEDRESIAEWVKT